MGTFTNTLGQRSSKARSGRAVGQHATDSAAMRMLDGLGTVCFWIIIFVVPLTMAVIRETGVAVFVGCSLLIGITWSIRQLWAPQTGSPFSLVVLLAGAAVLLVGLQLVPLPRAIVEQLSPFSHEFFPAWNAGLQSLPQQNYWNRISMTPALTRSGFVLLIAYVTFFLTLLQRIKTISDVDTILRLLSIATVVMALIGLGQLLFGNGEYLWMLKHPFRDASWPAKGTFTNQNHFAHYLALGIGPLVWSWKKAGAMNGNDIKGKVSNRGFGTSRSSDSNQQLIGGAIAIVVLAAVLSFSRGGIVSIVIACAVSMFALGRQSAGILKLAIPTVGFMTVGLLLFGTDMLETKWQVIMEAESIDDLCRGRSWLWMALLTALPSFWPTGSGVGSHAEVYPTWMEQDIGKRLSHAESGYLQVLIETGLPGFLLLLAVIGLCVYWASNNWKHQDPENRVRRLVLSAGLLASVLHSIVDFVWYIPACLIFALILAACLCRTHQLGEGKQETSNKRTTQITWPVCWAMIIALVALPVARLSADVALRDAESESAWESYREQAVTVGNRRNFASLDELDERLELMITHLEECHRIDPADCRALSELSALYVHRFEQNQQAADNPMSLQEIRSTVESTEFESPKEILKWLRRAFGGNAADLYRAYAAAEKAVQGQPLRGECYVVLAQLNFLRNSSVQERTALINQAVVVRPYEGRILYFAGMSEVEKGDLERACEWWKKAFHVSDKIQPLIIQTLAAHYTPQEIVDRIDPGPDGLWSLYKEYEAQGPPEHKDWVAERYAQDFESYLPQVEQLDKNFWLRSSDIFKASGKTVEAVDCMGKAIEQTPQNYQLRKKFGLLLMTAQDTAAAAKEFEWCLLRNPDDQQVTDLLASIRKKPLHGGGS